MFFNASYSQKLSYSDWNWKYHQRKHLTVFWKQSKTGLWKYFWGSLHEGLKLVYSNSYYLVSVQEDFKIFIGKRWRTSVNLSQWITLLKQIVSLEKEFSFPWAVSFYLEKVVSWKIGVCDFNIHWNFWGSKGVVERKLKSFFNFF